MNEENNFLFYIIIIIIIILSFIIIFNDNKKNLNNELEETHQICPITGFHTNLSVCIEYPQLNEAYIISVNNKRCISLIQESFDKDDHKWAVAVLSLIQVHEVGDGRVHPVQVAQGVGVFRLGEPADDKRSRIAWR